MNLKINWNASFDTEEDASGYIIIDVKRSFIEEILAKAKTCLGSQEMFVLANGTQIEANAGKVTLAEQPFYQKALVEDVIQGFSYEKVAGKELLSEVWQGHGSVFVDSER